MSNNRKPFNNERRRNSRGMNIFLTGRNRNKKTDNLSKSERLMRGTSVWASFYRANPHRFVKDYFGINLKIFQQILIFAMMHNHYFMYLSSRGQGKTFLTAIYVCTRAILFPGSKIVIAAGIKAQSREVIEKIKEIRDDSPNLQREIFDLNDGVANPRVDFHNGSWIQTVAANDGGRGKRANVLVVDEFRMVDFNVISAVLRKFLTAERRPKYLDKPEYAHLKERNQELYLSSAWFKHHWSYGRMQAYYKSMMEGKKYFVAGIPYQLAIKSGLLNKDQVEDEMSEDDFDPTLFEMEMECLFFGESEKAYFKHEELIKNRRATQALYPRELYDVVRDANFKPPIKKDGELRILSVDIALMGGKNNDASVFSVLTLNPTSRGYERNVSYIETLEGGNTEIQAVKIKRMFNDFNCDYLSLDTAGAGLGVFDLLVNPVVDQEYGIEYEPWTCVNDPEMAKRCIYPDAKEVIYSIKAHAKLNSEIAISLKDNLRTGKVRLLTTEIEAKESIRNLRGYSNLDTAFQVELEAPYMQTTLLINEMINLEGERNSANGQIKLTEPRSGRKDRYSSVSYGNYVANILERQLNEKSKEANYDDYMFFMSSGMN